MENLEEPISISLEEKSKDIAGAFMYPFRINTDRIEYRLIMLGISNFNRGSGENTSWFFPTETGFMLLFKVRINVLHLRTLR